MFKEKKKRSAISINAGSMADIAFLLLIFFLVTTTINAEKGIPVKLPPYEKDVIPEPIINRNLLKIKVNYKNELLVEGEEEKINNLRERTKEFIMNPQKRDDMPVSPQRAIVSIQNDRGTSYETYIAVYNEIKGAYNELWDELSSSKFNKKYDDLDKEQKKKIQGEIPLIISEAEPVDNQ